VVNGTDDQLAASPLEAVNQRHRRSGQRNGGIAAWVVLHSSTLCATLKVAMPKSMAKRKAKAKAKSKPRAKAGAREEVPAVEEEPPVEEEVVCAHDSGCNSTGGQLAASPLGARL
jgi:hypothetical protein